MKLKKHSRTYVLAALSLFAGTASAHTGDHATVTGFAGGLAHPLLGLDHLFAMIAIGLAAIYALTRLSAMRRPDWPKHWLSKLRMVYLFDLPTRLEQRLARMKAWLRARKIPLSDERTQANAFFAATVTGDAVSHLGENFSRDYFIERIEQMTQTALSPSIYPHLSLGPGQRFASKGGYVVGFPPGEGGTPVAISEWVIP